MIYICFAKSENCTFYPLSYLVRNISLRNTDLVWDTKHIVKVFEVHILRLAVGGLHQVGGVARLLQSPLDVEIIPRPEVHLGVVSAERLQHGGVAAGDRHVPLLPLLLGLGDDLYRGLPLLLDDGSGRRGLEHGGHDGGHRGLAAVAAAQAAAPSLHGAHLRRQAAT